MDKKQKRTIAVELTYEEILCAAVDLSLAMERMRSDRMLADTVAELKSVVDKLDKAALDLLVQGRRQTRPRRYGKEE